METSDFGDFEETHKSLVLENKTPESVPQPKPVVAPIEPHNRLKTIDALLGSERFYVTPNEPLLSFPTSLISKLKPCTLFVSCDSMLAAFTTSKKGFPQCIGAKIPTFLGGELTSFSWAAENDRLWPKDFRLFLTTKSKNPHWRMTPQIAFHKIPLSNFGPPQWSLGQMLRRVQASLIAIEMYQ